MRFTRLRQSYLFILHDKITSFFLPHVNQPEKIGFVVLFYYGIRSFILLTLSRTGEALTKITPASRIPTKYTYVLQSMFRNKR